MYVVAYFAFEHYMEFAHYKCYYYYLLLLHTKRQVNQKIFITPCVVYG